MRNYKKKKKKKDTATYFKDVLLEMKQSAHNFI